MEETDVSGSGSGASPGDERLAASAPSAERQSWYLSRRGWKNVGGRRSIDGIYVLAHC